MTGYRLTPDAPLQAVPPMTRVTQGIPLPPTADDRVTAFRARWRSQKDFCRALHDAAIAGGVIWLDSRRKRPIPRHRALTIPSARVYSLPSRSGHQPPKTSPPGR